MEQVTTKMEIDKADETTQFKVKSTEKQRLFVAGFKKTTPYQEIKGFLSKYGEIERIIFLGSANSDSALREFTGSVLVTFSDFEVAKSLRQITKLKYADEKLCVIWEWELQQDRKTKKAIRALKKKLLDFKQDRGFTNNHVIHLVGIPSRVTEKDLKELFKHYRWPVSRDNMILTEGNKDVFVRLLPIKSSRFLIRSLKVNEDLVFFNSLVKAKFIGNERDLIEIMKRMEDDIVSQIKQLEETLLWKYPEMD